MPRSGPSMPQSTSVSILRPAKASRSNLELQQFIEDSGVSKKEVFSIADDCSLFELQHEVKRSDTLREIIEWTSHHIKIVTDITEYQVRRSQLRDCYTHDLSSPERAGALRANVITFQDPNLGQIRFIKEFMRYALCQRCIVIYQDGKLVDEYIDDLSLHETGKFTDHDNVSKAVESTGYDVIPPDEEAEFFAGNRVRKIYLVDGNNEDRIEQAVSNALLSLQN